MPEYFAVSSLPFHSDIPSWATSGQVKAGSPSPHLGAGEGGRLCAVSCELGNSFVTLTPCEVPPLSCSL